MKARVLRYRGGVRTRKTNQLLLSVNDVGSRKSASALIGRKVCWNSPSGKPLVGKVVSAHGNSGVVRARFSKGVPGQLLGKDIELLE